MSRYYLKTFACVNALILNDNPISQTRKRGTELLSYFPKDTQLVSYQSQDSNPDHLALVCLCVPMILALF